MMPTRAAPALRRLLPLALLALLLAGCGGSHGDSDDEDDGAPAARGVVTVSTALPRQQSFHDTVTAWGSAVSDPQRARVISLGHGGQLQALKVSAGQRVRRGEPLLVIAPDPAARSAYQQAQSAAQLARSELARASQMAAQRLATQSQLAAARKAAADAEAALAAQRALGGGSAEETIVAPADGVVTALSVGQGERFAANAPLLTFAPDQALVAELGVQPSDGSKLRAGMAVRLHGVYGNAPALDGTLAMIGAAVDPQSHLLPARVSLPAQAGATLVAGAPLRATIETSDVTAWAVPRDAVLHDAHGDYLFQLDHGKARRVDVTLRSPDGDPVGVLGPLDAKAPVIVQGVYELHDGDAVQEPAR
ncbi:efflux RND transporter periplasmic adaptor subunit [Dyella ginsengisoli]|uniref:Efflux RND transporter periplasmic adaptor subunit n=1 Tax=Dyella ginsengisoli TaxID=363848 RepID=A0ABW8JPP8_9GAMM